MITKEELKNNFYYNRRNGVFRAKTKRVGIRGLKQAVGSIQKNGYLGICFERKLYYAHRLAWLWVYGEWPNNNIDHKNGNKKDNRIANLRLANPSQNTFWRKLNKNNTSGFRGVCMHRPSGKYVAAIKVDWQQIYLGYFSDPKEAARVYDVAAVKHFGTFAKTNKMMGLLK